MLHFVCSSSLKSFVIMASLVPSSWVLALAMHVHCTNRNEPAWITQPEIRAILLCLASACPGGL